MNAANELEVISRQREGGVGKKRFIDMFSLMRLSKLHPT